MRIEDNCGACGQQHAGQERSPGVEHAASHPPDRQDSGDGADDGGDTVHPDGVAVRVCAGEDVCRCGLGPVDEWRFVESGFVLNHGDREAAGVEGGVLQCLRQDCRLEHLAASLCEARLVTIDGRRREETRQIAYEARCNEQECLQPCSRKHSTR